jgi:hypothetical protein
MDAVGSNPRRRRNTRQRPLAKWPLDRTLLRSNGGKRGPLSALINTAPRPGQARGWSTYFKTSGPPVSMTSMRAWSRFEPGAQRILDETRDKGRRVTLSPITSTAPDGPTRVVAARLSRRDGNAPPPEGIGRTMADQKTVHDVTYQVHALG